VSQATSTIETLFDDYIAIWNEIDPDRRRSMIARVWAEDATYRDPVLSGEGRDGIDAMTAGFQAAYPGHTFDRQGEASREGDGYRFEWILKNPEGEQQIVGSDVAGVNAAGQLRSIVGEFDMPVPE
jgi:SnoaL-like domain